MSDTDPPTEPTPAKKLSPTGGEFQPLEVIAPGHRYRRSSLHASGGMGTVWLAWDAAIGRQVAVKELREGGEPGAARFVREAKITGQLEHPGVVPVYELGQDAETGRPFYVMRFIRGRTLSQSARAFHTTRSPGWHDGMELVRLLSAFVSVCNTIGYAHSHGIIHRDLKGENIVLGEFGEVIVLDWGVAKRIDSPELAAAETTSESDPVAGRTKVGELVGTLSYMAPEQAEGVPELIGPHTDIFGLGAILYEILSGRPPYAGGTYQNLLLKALLLRFDPPRAFWPGVPEGLEAICLKAMAKDPADRYPSPTALAEAVQGWQENERLSAEHELREAFDRLRRQQSALVALTHAEVISVPDLDAVFRRLVEVSADTLGVERVSVWRLSTDRTVLRCHALFELTPGRHSAGMELQATDYPGYFAALAGSEVIAAEDARTDPRTREFADGYLGPLGIGAMMEVPILPDGVLCHEHVGPPRKWRPDEELFAIAVGHLAAHAITLWERRTG